MFRKSTLRMIGRIAGVTTTLLLFLWFLAWIVYETRWPTFAG